MIKITKKTICELTGVSIYAVDSYFTKKKKSARCIIDVLECWLFYKTKNEKKARYSEKPNISD